MRPAGSDGKPCTQGFTLLELLVVLVILGLATTIVPPLFSGALPTLTLKGAVRDMQLALRRTRSESITRNHSTEVRLLPDENYYLVGSNNRQQRFPSDVRVALGDGVLGTGARVGGVVRFFPDGSSSGGDITLSSGDQRYRLSVDWITGRTRLYEVDDVDG